MKIKDKSVRIYRKVCLKQKYKRLKTKVVDNV